MNIAEILKLQIADIETEMADCKRDIKELCEEVRKMSEETDDIKLMDHLDGLNRRITAVRATYDALEVKKSDYQYLLNQGE
ncbi:MAG: hypothetical protein PUB46_00570 [Lachnospiraceae bacterium]|uniref:hypothetical protein n=1 Tax=Roseburia hominis TaxID=301301 RepID=UPI001F273B35|nr:hypothetical protein [Roseburia hominis]MCI5713102.1 hypothetical protein [Lachnospiraceae bacterium]MDD6168556.1 hypothetical protein [Lachnospiraceae bacterium]MDY4840540.1 hypothetical protein [Lachnospiraceae bacterium]